MSYFNSWIKFIRLNKYALYVLFMFMLSYLLNQLNTFSLVATNVSMAQEIGYGDRRCDVREENVTSLEEFLYVNGINMSASEYCHMETEELCTNDAAANETWCYWRYLGTGWEYQLLAGPLYIVMFSIGGIPLGLISELSNTNRKVFLVGCFLLWSLLTILGGFATRYWHVCLSRLLLGIAAAGCVPFCASLIGDYFTKSQRGSALGFFNWGIYVGYSMSFVLLIVDKHLGWRAVYFISGTPGIVVALIVFATVKEPPRGGGEMVVTTISQMTSMTKKLSLAAKDFATPCLLLLCLGGAIRNGAGIVWAYNVVNFFNEYHPDVDLENWMSWIPLVFGSLGAFGGGYLSDKLSVNKGAIGRLLVLMCCLLLSAPFQAGLLYLSYPLCFVSHMVGYLIGEMWIGVCIAVVLDEVSPELSASSVAVYFFIIQIIGGNMPLFVTPITHALSLRMAMLICFPGFYFIAALVFLLAILFVKKKENNIYDLEDNKIEEDETVVQISSTTKLKT